MTYIIDLDTYSDERGDLTVIQKILPFEIKRIYYIYNNKNNLPRGGHRHHKTIQALICLNGNCTISTSNSGLTTDYTLNKPNKCLILNPEDWHTMHSFSENSILLVLASEYFNPDDYIHKQD
ncbi:FdtA/QdtA family cupin domain-containing protein [Methanolobus vulcani]|uniref:WxcM-like domain-containing protein n=1 Tax=Methanolobus vulcani TaxID=38026 RepID=A0A7Z8P0F7_9EURY|nr:FdtA/QdtA family cupin domain-containing protein [Methanolobus vulcani]TQD23854.1 WxcM-like domain-containing protein [Methanolobus vulcani]